MSLTSTAVVRRSRGPALLACLLAGATAALCENVHAATREAMLSWQYLAVCTGLVVGGSALVGLLAQLARVPVMLALGAWIALAASVLHGWIAAPCFALAYLVAALPQRRSPAPAMMQAAFAGALFSLAWIYSGWLTPVIAAGKLTAEQAQLGRHATAYFVLAFAAAWLLRSPRVRAAPALTWIAVLVLAAAASVSPHWWRGTDPLEAPPPAPAVAAEPGHNVLLIVLDTLRADHTSVYGYGRRTTPELERLLATRPGAVRYPDAYANASWTVPAHATLLTGQLPSVHGAEHSGELPKPPPDVGIYPEIPSLVEGMRAKGRTTLAVFANPWLRQARGLSRGFEIFDYVPPAVVPRGMGELLRSELAPSLRAQDVKPHAPAALINARLLQRLDSVRERRFFALANFMDTHGPNTSPADVAGTFGPHSIFDSPRMPRYTNTPEENRRVMNRYDEQVLDLDRRVGELFSGLEVGGILDTTWVIVVSDHGESFGEHGVMNHGSALFDEQVHVPLLIFPPRGVELTLAPGPVSQIDVAATIAAICGVECSGPGRDLRTSSDAGVVQIQRGASRFRTTRSGPLAALESRAVVRWPWKLLCIKDELHLFDIAADPDESNDLAAARPDLVAELQSLLPEKVLRSAVFEPGTGEDQGDQADTLRQLGY